jgi:predicted nucleotidyltransferase component of viral defense system
MNNKNLRQYISFIKTRFPKISEMMIEKDYYLSLFLTKAQELKNKNKLKEFDNLIFKGGTLLNKLYLNYHRISEDLDFNHIKSNSIRDLSSTNKIGKCIKKIELDLIDDIKEISDTCGFDFKINRSPVA